jgi:hypothetical protein
MDFIQTYETTITSPDNRLSATVLVIPARSFRLAPLDRKDSLELVANILFNAKLHDGTTVPYIDIQQFVKVFRSGESRDHEDEALQFATYVANARIIPFESSPLGAEALASIAAASVKAGPVTLGATVGFIAAGPTPFLLITVPLGIILCGASVSFAKWMVENRNAIWDRLAK